MKNLKGLSFEAVAFEVCTAFDRAGLTAVLSGGGAATIYAPEAYETRDLDFVLHWSVGEMPSTSLLTELGYKPSNASGTYENPDSPYTLEILRGPLAVGEETIFSWNTLSRLDQAVLHIIWPIDCVKDRLSAAIHWRDLNSARQAAEVARRHPIDLGQVERWCRNEGGEKTLNYFLQFLNEGL